MTVRPLDDAALAQVRAADPARSTWVSANAGSGKTRVLTGRVARLLLAGAPPERILCVTFTKAAAAEMQNRLFDMLGRWAMLDDGALAAALAALSETPEPLDPGRLAADCRNPATRMSTAARRDAPASSTVHPTRVDS